MMLVYKAQESPAEVVVPVCVSQHDVALFAVVADLGEVALGVLVHIPFACFFGHMDG